jgi:hypothetical protein
MASDRGNIMQTEAVFSGPIELKDLHRRIEAWRRTQPGTRPMPEELWKEARGYARKLGICRVSRALRVNYGGLKRRVLARGIAAVGSRRSERTPAVVRPEFVELSGLPALGALSEAAAGSDAVVEVAAPDGTRLTIRVKGATSPNVAAWVSAFRGRP